jgi:serine/threonine protein kinase
MLSDFDISTRIATKSTITIREGTRFYAAPEIYITSESGRAADVWAFGLVFLQVIASLAGIRRVSEWAQSSAAFRPTPGIHTQEYISTKLERILQESVHGDSDGRARLGQLLGKMLSCEPSRRAKAGTASVSPAGSKYGGLRPTISAL